jgi:hypothetical protein
VRLSGAVAKGASAVTGTGASVLHALHIPSFDVGTNSVPQDMLAMVHQGEAIVPKAYNDGGGGGHTFHMPITVDARGSIDPAQVEAHGYRGAMKAAPQLAQIVYDAIENKKGRLPR